MERRTLPRAPNEAALSAAASKSARAEATTQRWRERPRCCALHLAPACRDGVVHAIVGRVACPCLRAQIVRDNRATRAAMVVPSCERRSGPAALAAIGSRTSPVLPQNTSPFRVEIEPRHHRADDAGAVLDVVNALRFASTRPVAGPSGIDDACARH